MDGSWKRQILESSAIRLVSPGVIDKLELVEM